MSRFRLIIVKHNCKPRQIKRERDQTKHEREPTRADDSTKRAAQLRQYTSMKQEVRWVNITPVSSTHVTEGATLISLPFACQSGKPRKISLGPIPPVAWKSFWAAACMTHVLPPLAHRAHFSASVCAPWQCRTASKLTWGDQTLCNTY